MTDLPRTPGTDKRTSFVQIGLVFLLALSGLSLARTITVEPVPNPDKSEESYNSQISKTYDFNFGSNPFAPGNATR